MNGELRRMRRKLTLPACFSNLSLLSPGKRKKARKNLSQDEHALADIPKYNLPKINQNLCHLKCP